MTKTLKVILPPIVGLLFTVVSYAFLYTVLMNYGASIDFVGSIKLSPIIILVFLFAKQWLLVSTVSKLLKVFTWLTALAFVLFLLIGFSYYIKTGSFNVGIMLGFGSFPFLFLFYCIGNAATLCLLQKVDRRSDTHNSPFTTH